MTLNRSSRSARAGMAVLSGTAAIMIAQPAVAAPNACSLAKADRRTDLVHAPFRTVDGRIYVDVLVDGRGPYVFALDTGASGMGRADAGLVTALGLAAAGTGRSSDGIKQVDVDLVKVRSLKFGNLERRDQEIIARDYRSRLSPEAAFAGILGRGFFADGLLIIDYPNSTVSFTRSRSMRPAMRGAMTYENAFRIPVKIGGITTRGNLDTGANIALVLPKALYDQISTEPVKDTATATFTNSKIETGRSTIRGPVQIGNVSSSDVPVRVSDKFSEALVGAHFLQNRVVLIDQRTNSVAICPARPRPGRR